MLTGKQLRPRQALKAGLVDEVVPQAILLQAAVELALKGRPTSREVPVRERVLAGPLGRHLLFQFVGKQTQRKTQGNYPAVKRILQVVENGLAHGCSSGYAEEARIWRTGNEPAVAGAAIDLLCQYRSEKTLAPRRASAR